MKNSESADRFGAQPSDADLGYALDAALQSRQAEDRWGPDPQPPDPRGRPVGRLEIKSGGMPHPPPQRALQAGVVAPGNVGKGGSAGTPIEVLVTATHREIGTAVGEIHFDRAGGVGQVPQHDGTRVVSCRGHRRHILHLPGSEIDVGEHQHRNVGGERPVDFAARNQAQLDVATEQILQPLRDVEIGPEVLEIRKDHPAFGTQTQGRAQQLEEVDGDRVGDRDLVCRGADQRRDRGRHPFRQVDPAGAGPAADKASPPLLCHDRLDPCRDLSGWWPERVAVEVDDAVRQNETVTETGDRVAVIEVERVVS